MTAAQQIHSAFRFSIAVKGIFAVLDIIGGLLLTITGTNPLVQLVTRLAQGELGEDPNDLLATHFLQFAQQYSPGRPVFVITYLFIHGLINAVLVLGLWRQQIWAYLFALYAMGIFMVYQLYRLSHGFSTWLLILTVFDLGVMWLVWCEYQTKMA